MSRHASSDALLKRVEGVLRGMSLEFVRSNQVNGFEIEFASDEPPFMGVAIVDYDGGRFVFYLLLSDPIPAQAREAIMSFITRSNLDMLAGCFELDLDGGELRFRAVFNFNGIALEKSSIEHTIRAALEAVNAYYPGLDKVLRGVKAPAEAVREIEKALDEPATR